MSSGFTWNTKKVIGLAAIVAALTQVGNGLRGVSYLIGVPEIAYAAKETAESVDERFERYIERQDAVAEALNSYVQEQRQQSPMDAPAPEAQWFRETDAQGCWECWGYSYQDCDVNLRWSSCQ